MYEMTIDGRAAASQGYFDVVNPTTGEVFERAPECTPSQLDEAMHSASRAFPAWAADEPFRIAKLRELADAISEASGELAGILTLENGKTADIAALEGSTAATWLNYYAGLEIAPEILQNDERARVSVLRRPLGVVAAIAPWNMPIAVSFFKLAPALRAGNTVVLKPSPFTPLATLRLGEIAREVLPKGVLNIVTGGDRLGALMTSHPVPRKISFTGSVETGKKVAVSAAADLKRVTLELGGNDPAILLDDVDLDAIAQGLFWTAFFNNGQACTLVKRVYAPASRYDEVVEALAAQARAVPVGDPTDAANLLGPLSTKFQLERVSSLVKHALSHGAVAAAGGRAIDGKGFFFEPTILRGVDDGLRIVDEEQFGPALPVIPYTDVDDAIARANATNYGLGASVWSSDLDRGAAVASKLQAGTTWVNTHAVLTPFAPFAGHKWSGLGVENGPWGFDGFTELQVLHENRGAPGPGTE